MRTRRMERAIVGAVMFFVASVMFALGMMVAAALAQSTQGIPFRRMTDPVQLPVGATAQNTMIPPEKLSDATGNRYNSFYVVNPNRTYVRAKGFSTAADCQNNAVTTSTGWLWPPGFVGVFSTQFPLCGSVMAVPMPGYPLPADGAYAPVEWSYGFGQ